PSSPSTFAPAKPPDSPAPPKTAPTPSSPGASRSAGLQPGILAFVGARYIIPFLGSRRTATLGCALACVLESAFVAPSFVGQPFMAVCFSWARGTIPLARLLPLCRGTIVPFSGSGGTATPGCALACSSNFKNKTIVQNPSAKRFSSTHCCLKVRCARQYSNPSFRLSDFGPISTSPCSLRRSVQSPIWF